MNKQTFHMSIDIQTRAKYMFGLGSARLELCQTLPPPWRSPVPGCLQRLGNKLHGCIRRSWPASAGSAICTFTFLLRPWYPKKLRRCTKKDRNACSVSLDWIPSAAWTTLPMFCKSKAETALEGRPRVLGPDHEHACSSMNNVANGLREQGRWKEAEEMRRKASDGPWTRPPRNTQILVPWTACAIWVFASRDRLERLAFQGWAFEGSVFPSEASWRCWDHWEINSPFSGARGSRPSAPPNRTGQCRWFNLASHMMLKRQWRSYASSPHAPLGARGSVAGLGFSPWKAWWIRGSWRLAAAACRVWAGNCSSGRAFDSPRPWGKRGFTKLFWKPRNTCCWRRAVGRTDQRCFGTWEDQAKKRLREHVFPCHLGREACISLQNFEVQSEGRTPRYFPAMPSASKSRGTRGRWEQTQGLRLLQTTRKRQESFEEKMAAFLLVPQRACKVTLNGLMRFNVVA